MQMDHFRIERESNVQWYLFQQEITAQKAITQSWFLRFASSSIPSEDAMFYKRKRGRKEIAYERKKRRRTEIKESQARKSRNPKKDIKRTHEIAER